jgi:hypothetical protein
MTGMFEKRNTYKVLVESPKGKSPLGSTGTRRQNNIRIDYKNMMSKCELDLCGSA